MAFIWSDNDAHITTLTKAVDAYCNGSNVGTTEISTALDAFTVHGHGKTDMWRRFAALKPIVARGNMELMKMALSHRALFPSWTQPASSILSRLSNAVAAITNIITVRDGPISDVLLILLHMVIMHGDNDAFDYLLCYPLMNVYMNPSATLQICVEYNNRHAFARLLNVPRNTASNNGSNNNARMCRWLKTYRDTGFVMESFLLDATVDPWFVQHLIQEGYFTPLDALTSMTTTNRNYALFDWLLLRDDLKFSSNDTDFSPNDIVKRIWNTHVTDSFHALVGMYRNLKSANVAKITAIMFAKRLMMNDEVWIKWCNRGTTTTTPNRWMMLASDDYRHNCEHMFRFEQDRRSQLIASATSVAICDELAYVCGQNSM